MRRPLLIAALAACMLAGQQTPVCARQAPYPADNARPLPDTRTLLADVEHNQKRLEALQRDYTYHVHTEEQELNKDGGVKKSETTDAESLTIQGVRVNKVVARNGKSLTPEEAKKEDERIDKTVAQAKERLARAEDHYADTDPSGNPIVPLSRILELGSFSNPRRVEQNGRPVIVLDYAGNPQAKTRSQFEAVIRDLVGTVWIDEADHVLIRGQGHFVNDFKLGGGLLADIHKDSSFDFRATRVGEGVWLPAAIDGQGSVRILLLAHFNGRLHLLTSDYQRFHTDTTIVGSHGVIDAEGNPLPKQDDSAPGAAPVPHP